MKLYDIVSKAQYMQVFSIYLTNAYDQNIPIARGTRSEMLGLDVDENEEEFFIHLMCDNEEFYNFECHDIECVDAWRPLPKPYKAQEVNE